MLVAPLLNDLSGGAYRRGATPSHHSAFGLPFGRKRLRAQWAQHNSDADK
jgi:hypothetical protein